MILSTGHYQNMIIQHHQMKIHTKALDTCINSKIQSNHLRFVRKYKMCFREPEWKFLNDKHQVSNFYELHKIHKSSDIESAINT